MTWVWSFTQSLPFRHTQCSKSSVVQARGGAAGCSRVQHGAAGCSMVQQGAADRDRKWCINSAAWIMWSCSQHPDNIVSSNHDKLSWHLRRCLLHVCRRFLTRRYLFSCLLSVRSFINPPTSSLWIQGGGGILCCVHTSTSPGFLLMYSRRSGGIKSVETKKRLTLTFAFTHAPPPPPESIRRICGVQCICEKKTPIKWENTHCSLLHWIERTCCSSWSCSETMQNLYEIKRATGKATAAYFLQALEAVDR